jgi:hypothetical protein
MRPRDIYDMQNNDNQQPLFEVVHSLSIFDGAGNSIWNAPHSQLDLIIRFIFDDNIKNCCNCCSYGDNVSVYFRSTDYDDDGCCFFLLCGLSNCMNGRCGIRFGRRNLNRFSPCEFLLPPNVLYPLLL